MSDIKALRAVAALWQNPTHLLAKPHLWLRGGFPKADLRPLRDSPADLIGQERRATPAKKLLSQPVLLRRTRGLKELARLSGEPIETLRRRFALREIALMPKALAHPFLEAVPALAEQRCREIFCAGPSILAAFGRAYLAGPICADAGWNILSMPRAVDRLLLGAEPVGKTG